MLWFQYISTECISVILVSQILDLLISKDFVFNPVSATHFLLSDPVLVFCNRDLLVEHTISEVVSSGISFEWNVIENISMLCICLVYKLGCTSALSDCVQDCSQVVKGEKAD